MGPRQATLAGIPQGIRRRQGKNGVTYQVQIRIRGQRPVTKTFPKLVEAKRWKSQTETEIRERRYFGSSEGQKRTLAEAIDRYLAQYPEKKDRPSQLRWWKEEIGQKVLADVTPSLIVECRERLQQGRQRASARYEAGRSPATVNRYLAALSHLFTVAVKEWEWLPDSPMRQVSKLKEPRGRVRFLDDDERGRLLEACQGSADYRLYPLVVLALSTGARKSELLGLRWRDVDTQKGLAVLHHTKNGERRTIAVRGHALEQVKALRKVRRLDTDLVFPSDSGEGSLEPREAWVDALRVAKIEDFRFHDLRHCAASYLAMNGASLAEIAEVLGHKTLQMVKRYAHLTDQHVGTVVEAMNQKIFGGAA